MRETEREKLSLGIELRLGKKDRPLPAVRPPFPDRPPSRRLEPSQACSISNAIIGKRKRASEKNDQRQSSSE